MQRGRERRTGKNFPWFRQADPALLRDGVCQSVLSGRRIRVVARLVADIEILGRGPGDGHFDAVKWSSRLLIFGVIADQVLRAQVFAHLSKCLVEAALADVEALAAGLLGQSDQRV